MGLLIVVVFSFIIAYADYAYKRHLRRKSGVGWYGNKEVPKK